MSDPPIDTSQIIRDALAEEAFPASGRGQFRVFISPEAHQQIWKHAKESLTAEICGVLVGEWRRDVDGPYLGASDIIRCDSAKSSMVEVTFTHESWAHINKEMDCRFGALRIVGWYHSHPDFGIFLSDRDVFIHQHFFSGPGQIALVVDPIRSTEGVFVWRKGKPILAGHYWVGDRVISDAVAERGAVAEPASAASSAPLAPTALPRAGGEPRSIIDRPAWILTGLLLLLVGFLLGSLKSDYEQRQLLEGAVAHYGLWKVTKPGLEEQLELNALEVEKIANVLDQLSREHLKLAGKEPGDASKSWNAALSAIGQLKNRLRILEDLYGLNPTERAVVDDMVKAAMKQAAQGTKETPAKANATEKAPAPKTATPPSAESPSEPVPSSDPQPSE